jgi:hypothetical protein
MKSIFFWDMTPCSALSGIRRFGGTYRLHLQGRRIVQRSSEQALQNHRCENLKSYLFNDVCQLQRYRSTLVSETCSVRISAGTPSILTWFSPVPPGKCRDSTSIRPGPTPSKSFLIHHHQSSYHWMLYNLDTEKVRSFDQDSNHDLSNMKQKCSPQHLDQWYSTWGTCTPGGTQRHLRGYAKTS